MKKLAMFIDFWLLLIVFSLCGIGFVAVSSATQVDLLGTTREIRIQVIAFVIGVFAMILANLVSYRYYARFYWFFYALGIFALLLVYIPGLGVERFNARSWLKLGPIFFQTSEVAKFTLILTLAGLLNNIKSHITRFKDIILPTIVCIPYFFLVFKQPDFGTVLVLVFIFVGMVFASNLQFRVIFAIMLAVLLASPILYSRLNEYQQKRIISFVFPDEADSGDRFQKEMSEITIGSGKIFGEGIFKGQFSANGFLPVRQSDFIFSVWVEETGFIGGAVVILLYFLFCSRIIFISFLSKDRLGSYLCIGVLFMFAFQIFENLGMTMGVMPITGLPLPFVSYGGSSMILNFVILSLVMNVHYRAKSQIESEKERLF